MGFEFETGYVLEKEVSKGQFQKLNKGDVLQELGDGLRVTADENSAGFSALEMVLDPPVQEEDPKKFTKALERFRKSGEKLDGIRKEDTVRHTLAKVLSGPKDISVTPRRMGFYGSPQMTGGIAFDRLFKFLEETTTSATPAKGSEGAAKATQYKDGAGDLRALTGAKVEIAKVHGSDELKGLVAMLAMYLNSGAKSSGPMFNYAKLISNSFMARTDFGAMFAMLPTEDYERYTRAPLTFVSLVLDAAGLAGQGDKQVFERGIRKSYDAKNLPDYNTDITSQVPGLDITRSSWLLGVTLGEDRIGSKGMPALKAYFEGLGALGGKTDRVGGDAKPSKGAERKGSGIIVELRNMANNQSYTDFIGTAQQVFMYWAQLNSRDKGKGGSG